MLIVLTGPTASGKSSLAVKIALSAGNGEVISADSRQIYQGTDIGTGKVSLEEMKGIPHHLLNIFSAKEEFTVAQYKQMAEEKIQNIHQKGGLPILCGGTGFYIKAVVEGTVLPEVPPDKSLRDLLEKKSQEDLFSILEKKDPRSAKRLRKADKRRLVRALEIISKTGLPVPEEKSSPPSYRVLVIGLKIPLPVLEKRIEKRVNDMISRGLEKEAKRIFKKNGKLAKETIGYSEWQRYFNKEESLEKVRENIINNTKNYAKRQLRWLKKEKYVVWVNNEEKALKKAMSFLKKA